MITGKTLHPVRQIRKTTDGDFMMDEVHYKCQCGFIKAHPLTISGEREGSGIVVVKSDDPFADHVFNNEVI